MPAYRYPRPCVAADSLIVGHTAAGDQILLIRRGHDPYEGQWALPGGFVEVGDEIGAQGEDLHDAAARELAEETGLSGIPLTQVGAFGTPDRDPRARVITVLYRGELQEPLPSPRGGDDAADARWVPLRDVLSGDEPLAFDHLHLVRTAISGEPPP